MPDHTETVRAVTDLRAAFEVERNQFLQTLGRIRSLQQSITDELEETKDPTAKLTYIRSLNDRVGQVIDEALPG